jgi:hypothetical protein
MNLFSSFGAVWTRILLALGTGTCLPVVTGCQSTKSFAGAFTDADGKVDAGKVTSFAGSLHAAGLEIEELTLETRRASIGAEQEFFAELPIYGKLRVRMIPRPPGVVPPPQPSPTTTPPQGDAQ